MDLSNTYFSNSDLVSSNGDGFFVTGVGQVETPDLMLALADFGSVILAGIEAGAEGLTDPDMLASVESARSMHPISLGAMTLGVREDTHDLFREGLRLVQGEGEMSKTFALLVLLTSLEADLG